MREFGLLHETDLSLSSPRSAASLFDDCESAIPLEFDFVDDAHLIDLKVELNPPLSSLPFVALTFSSTPIDTIVTNLALLASLLPLAQCTGLEMGEVFTGDATILEDALLLRSKELTLVEPFLKEAPFEEFCGDIVMVVPLLALHLSTLFVPSYLI